MDRRFWRVSLSGPHLTTPPLSALDQQAIAVLLGSLPGGDNSFWGVPFALPSSSDEARWIWAEPGKDDVGIELAGTADFVVIAHFAIPSNLSAGGGDVDAQLPGVPLWQGEHLADYVLVYADGTEQKAHIRRHFEVGDLSSRENPFLARPHQESTVLEWRGPHADGRWGVDQQGNDGPLLVTRHKYRRGVELVPHYWVYSLRNPRPFAPLKRLRLEACGSTAVAIGGVTLYTGSSDPLHHERLQTLQIDLPGDDEADPVVQVDLGLVARQVRAVPFDPDTWLRAADAGSGSELVAQAAGPTSLIVEIAASEGAVLSVAGERIAMLDVLSAGVARSDVGRISARLLAPERQWVAVTIQDAATDAPTPARVHFRSADGRYLPPYGHRREVNDRWFEDYGADLQMGGTAYAYVDGRFDIELPIGDVYVEIVKGFEYTPIRSVVRVAEGMTTLALPLDRAMDWRARGWIAADTHVHFLSPETAWLEAQAEGINIVNLLASQWGDLFTNFGDFTGRPSGVSRDDTLIWVGTENRQHMLGHMSLLGISRPTTPVCAGGPAESYVGDPVWTGLSEWADRCHNEDGVVVIPHFPTPYCENVAATILGKVDAVEVRDFEWGVNTYAVREWYRLLNCGYRVAAVGGTDKMSAGIPVGGVRTYAHVGDRELSFGAWAEAVRYGRTITSSGPLIELTVEGRMVGDSLVVPPGGATLSVTAHASALQPLDLLEVVMNGSVVARVEGASADRQLHLATELHVTAGGWIAARCVGPTVQWHTWPVQTAAHTSPIYLVGKTDSRLAGADRAHLTTVLDGGLAWLEAMATRADEARHRTVVQAFVEARSRLLTDSSRGGKGGKQ